MKKFFKNSKNITKFAITGIFLLVFAIFFIIILNKTHFFKDLSSFEKIKQMVESGGVFSILIFMALQILQTTILQVPAILVTLAGTVVFGRFNAFLFSYISVMIGSVIMFFIGRKAGRKFLCWLVGKDSAEKWIKNLSNGKYLFFLMMIFPLFPDDILCVVAGMTNMSFNFFFVTNLIARGIGIASTVYLGTGAIIPFSGWGIAVWCVIGVVVAGLFYTSIKFKDKLDEIFNAMFARKNKNFKDTQK